MSDIKYSELYLKTLAETWKVKLAQAFDACMELEQIQQEYQEIYEFLDIDGMKDEDAQSVEDLLEHSFGDWTIIIGGIQGCAVPLDDQMTKWTDPTK